MCAVQRPDQRKKPSLLPWEDRRLTMSRMWSLRQYTLALSCLRRHLCQLRAYLNTAIEDMEAGRWEGIVGALLYPSLLPSPTSAVPTGPRSAGLGTCPSQPCRATESRPRRTERPPGGKIVSSVAPVLLPVAVTVVSNDTLFGRLMSAACSSSAGPQVNARHVPGSSAQVCS